MFLTPDYVCLVATLVTIFIETGRGSVYRQINSNESNSCLIQSRSDGINSSLISCAIYTEVDRGLAFSYDKAKGVCSTFCKMFAESEQTKSDVFSFNINKGCPTDWFHYRSHCYHFVTTLQNWTMSKAVCFDLKSNLVTIPNADTNTFLRKVIDNTIKEFGGYWTGGYFYKPTKTWKWPNGNLIKSFASWNQKFEGNEDSGQHCLSYVRMDSTGFWDGKWNDQNCSKELRCICEKP